MTEAENPEMIRKIAQAAYHSLILEVCTTPKPGLVDRRNNGAHRDMDLALFRRSAASLRPYFLACVKAGYALDVPVTALLPERLRPLGLAAEQEMFRVTGGVNTHKGAIFSLGIFCCAAGILLRYPKDPDFSLILPSICSVLTEDFLHVEPTAPATHGERLYLQYGITGIRGEAIHGFPSVFRVALPAYRNYRSEGLPRMDAGACTLLHLICVVEDTNLIFRSDYSTYLSIRQKTADFLRNASAADILSVLPEMDSVFIRKNLSPGGSADLLSLVYFLDLLSDFIGISFIPDFGNFNSL